jgi:3-phosphoshikimate 1-carboxyvinyltransferase
MFELEISGSKSESNRALILQSFLPKIEVQNLSNSDDTRWMQKALLNLKNGERKLECGHAGTVIRFLVARAVFEPDFKGIITGSKRLLSRPIQDLIDALQPFAKNIIQTDEGIEIDSLGEFEERANFNINATNSSQFVSALCLCAPRFKKGIAININGTLSSIPYITMTLNFLKKQGYDYTFTNTSIEIWPTNSVENNTVIVEPDWSSLSYWFSIATISQKSIYLKHYQKHSLQADSRILNFADHFGIEYRFENEGLVLAPTKKDYSSEFKADFDACPDIAPSFMALCAALRMPCALTGLHSLKHKECDRIVVMHKNLKQLGYDSTITDTDFSAHISPNPDFNKTVEINTDLDHRIAMSIAPLQFLFTNISFDDPEVVNKSYPNFWNDITSFKQYLKTK